MKDQLRVRRTAGQIAALLGIGFGLLAAANIVRADDHTSLEQLTAQWWQWAFSIPTMQNPLSDQTGQNCMIRQRGSVWFLAGLPSGGTASRTCSVIPAGTTLFFPVINAVGYNSPNCGQGPEDLSAKELRANVAAFIKTVTDLRVDLDDRPFYSFQRVQSDVFPISIPADNIAGCASGVYSPLRG
jgi:hypothetical protein